MISIYVCNERLLLSGLGQQIHPAANQLRQTALHRAKREKANPRLRVQFDGEIHVAVVAGVTASDSST